MVTLAVSTGAAQLHMGKPGLVLSIVIPSYNRAKTIAGTLEDYVQSFPADYHDDFEIVVALNGCTDGMSAIVKGYMTAQASDKYREKTSLPWLTQASILMPKWLTDQIWQRWQAG
jgi:cellulose synthase/poly-beta-1,6-N-acetylglucosamine synthase-like glycosyltransferase